MLSILSIALRAIFANRLRSALTMLGVMIGIAAVIALQAIGEGQKQAQLEIFDTMGANRIMIWPGGRRRGGVRGTSTMLQIEDAEALMKLPGVNLVSPLTFMQGRIQFRANNASTSIVGALPEYVAVENYKMQSGAMFEAADVLAWSRVAVIGRKTATDLYGARDPVAEEIKLNGKLFTVVGVFQEKGATPWFNPDEQVVVPITTAWNKLGATQGVVQMVVQAESSEAATDLEASITELLQQRYPMFLRDDRLFRIFNAAEMQAQREESSNVISTFLVVVGGIALFIGGIGIMNIMLVTVSERTREIGLRKAIGATPAAIMGQFLSEAVLLCALSGVLGVASGVGIATWLQGASEKMDFPAPIINQTAIWAAVAVSLTVGIVFGTTPALKAARMDPIRALRHE